MKKIMIFICLFFLVIFIPARAFAWGSATHAYFAKELGQKYGIENIKEMVYGAMLPDMFNLMYGSDYSDYLRHQTHYEFMKVVENASGKPLQALSFGFASHNDAWGTDYTAHHDGQTTPGKGYVITKVDILKSGLTPKVKDILVGAGVPDDTAQALAEELTPKLTEIFIEIAVDVLIKRNEDPAIGTSMLFSGQLPAFGVDSLLVKAYAMDFAKDFDLSIQEASIIIIGAENGFRMLTMGYGVIFINEESKVIELLGAQGVIIAESVLEALTDYDVTLPPGTDAVFAELLRDYAIPFVEGDYAQEVSATLLYLEEKLLPVGVEEKPQVINLLKQNRPNPFNPTTTIDYSIAEAGNVTIEIYNTVGQKVATLIDDYQDIGSYSVIWDGSSMAAGIYFYLLRTNNFVLTKKMLFLK